MRGATRSFIRRVLIRALPLPGSLDKQPLRPFPVAEVQELSHFFGGRHVAGGSGRFGDVFNPATGEIAARVALASRIELRKAVEAAKTAFPEWSGLNPQRRARVMFQFKALLEKHMDELAHLLSR